MTAIKIGIVEDEVIIAYDIQAKLTSLGYTAFEPVHNYADAVEMLTTTGPDLVILDINLDDKNEGIKIGKYIRSKLDMPFIYLTANSDPATVSKAKETMPDAYLLKPFNRDSLFSAIEIALYNFNKTRKAKTGPAENENKNAKYFFFTKSGEYFHRIVFDEILYLESEGNYVTVHTAQKKFIVRVTMHDFLENFDPARFIHIHRSFVVNLGKIEKINASNVVINGKEVPVSGNYREGLLKLLDVR